MFTVLPIFLRFDFEYTSYCLPYCLILYIRFMHIHFFMFTKLCWFSVLYVAVFSVMTLSDILYSFVALVDTIDLFRFSSYVCITYSNILSGPDRFCCFICPICLCIWSLESSTHTLFRSHSRSMIFYNHHNHVCRLPGCMSCKLWILILGPWILYKEISGKTPRSVLGLNIYRDFK